jgi:hypothetical protein
VLAVVEYWRDGNNIHQVLDADSSTAALRTMQFRMVTGASSNVCQFLVFNTAGSVFTASGTTDLVTTQSLGLNRRVAVIAGRILGTELSTWTSGRKEGTATLTGTARSVTGAKQLWLANTGRAQSAPNTNSIYAVELFDGALSDAFLASIKTPADYYAAFYTPRRIWVPVSVAAPTGPTVVAVTPTTIGSTSHRPRYTWTPA